MDVTTHGIFRCVIPGLFSLRTVTDVLILFCIYHSYLTDYQSWLILSFAS